MRKPEEIATAFSPTETLGGRLSFFLVGIGGAGMSALAGMLRHRGYRVRGSDSTASTATRQLEVDGLTVLIGHAPWDIDGNDAVIVSDAIDLANSPEVKRAKEVGAPVYRRSQLLGWLVRDRKVIAVTGTHGKTTTTGMIGAALRAAGVDPLIVVGAEVPEFGGSVIEGKGQFAVVEACEAYDGFHDLKPNWVVLTNLEPDHLDFHGTYERLKESTIRFIQRLPDDGALVYFEGDAGACDVAQAAKVPLVPYREPIASGMSTPGRHNALNARAAFELSKQIGIDEERALLGICAFRGAERRLQILRDGPIVVVDDYAHHPTEVEASIQALRERFPERRLVVVFQPHLYSRTSQLINEFAAALDRADYVVLTDIYPAREAPLPGVSSSRIAEKLTVPTDYIPSRHLLARHVARIAQPGDCIVGMGAGSISEFPPLLLQEIDRTGPIRVAVIYGGDSAEREVSLHSGLASYHALLERGYDAKLLDVTDRLLRSGDLQGLVGARHPDVAFLAVHGTHAEDGAIQGFLELLHIPYTGSGIQASAIAMDKALSKILLQQAGIRVPNGWKLLRGDAVPADAKVPLVVKPNAQGSTVGLSFVRDRNQLETAIERAFHYDNCILIEEWIEGMEISVPVLGDQALPPVEIVPQSGEYDFASKYIPGATEEICPARLPAEMLQEAERLALLSHHTLRCQGATRTDMMVRGDEIFVLEVNTLPGLTATSLLPKSAATAGISFADLVEWIVRDALDRYAKKE